VTGLLVVLLLLSLLLHQAAWGNGPVCASVSNNDLIAGISGTVSTPTAAPGSQATVAAVNICTSNPAVTVRLAGLFAVWPYILVWLIFLLRLGRVLKSASRPGGLYSPATAAGLRALGWLLVAGGIGAGVIESAANITIFTHLVTYRGHHLDGFEPAQVHFSVGTLLAGLALLSAARIMRQGVAMREELDATV
jgi:hypothetical protein